MLYSLIIFGYPRFGCIRNMMKIFLLKNVLFLLIKAQRSKRLKFEEFNKALSSFFSYFLLDRETGNNKNFISLLLLIQITFQKQEMCMMNLTQLKKRTQIQTIYRRAQDLLYNPLLIYQSNQNSMQEQQESSHPVIGIGTDNSNLYQNRKENIVRNRFTKIINRVLKCMGLCGLNKKYRLVWNKIIEKKNAPECQKLLEDPFIQGMFSLSLYCGDVQKSVILDSRRHSIDQIHNENTNRYFLTNENLQSWRIIYLSRDYQHQPGLSEFKHVITNSLITIEGKQNQGKTQNISFQQPVKDQQCLDTYKKLEDYYFPQRLAKQNELYHAETSVNGPSHRTQDQLSNIDIEDDIQSPESKISYRQVFDNSQNSSFIESILFNF